MARTVVLVGLLAGLLAAGCGGEAGEGDVAGVQAEIERQDLEQAVQAARDAVQQSLVDIARAGTPEQLADALEASAARIEEAADQLDARDAPPDFRRPKEELDLALDELAFALRQVAEDVERRDVGRAVADVLQLKALRDIRSALTALRDAGLDVEPLDLLDLLEPVGDDFENAVRAVRQEVERVLDEVRGARDPEALSDAVEKAAERLREAAERLDQASVPDTVQSARDDLVTALEQFAAELEQVASRVEQGDFRGALQGLGRLDAVEDVRRALEELRAAGVG